MTQRVAWIEYDATGAAVNCCVTTEAGARMLTRHAGEGHTTTTRPAREGETTAVLFDAVFPRDPDAAVRPFTTLRL